MSRRSRSVIVLCAVALVASGCGGGGQPDSAGSGQSESRFAPTDSPSATVSLTDDPAPDYSRIEGEGYTISAPGGFQRRRKQSSNGEPMLVLQKPSGVVGVPERVGVVRDVDPDSSAAEQSYALESFKSIDPDTGTRRVSLPAPEGESAFLITWNVSRSTADSGSVDVTYQQLMYQVNKDLILNVVAFAPRDQFDTSAVSTILRTFSPDS